MLRSLFTGISGLDAHQQMLDVTANNIANVNTVGFKSSSTEFEDTLSQTMSGGSATQNPEQVGLGVQLVATNLDFAQGSDQATGVPSNLEISGNGFFQVSKNNQTFYTRAGAFTVDNNGYLVTPDGAQLVDSAGNPVKIDPSWASYSIGANGVVAGVLGDGTPATPTVQIQLATFANPNGLLKAGDTEFSVTAASGPATMGTPGSGTIGTLKSGYVEMSNVDLSKELTNLIIAQRGFQANSKVITTSDQILQTLVDLKQ